MDVLLPNGETLRGVPEGTTKAQIAARLIATGRADSWLDEFKPKAPAEVAPQEEIGDQFAQTVNQTPGMAQTPGVGFVSGIADTIQNVPKFFKRSGAKLAEGVTELPAVAPTLAGNVAGAFPDAAETISDASGTDLKRLFGFASDEEQAVAEDKYDAKKMEANPQSNSERWGSAAREFAAPVTEAPIKDIRAWAQGKQKEAEAALTPAAQRAIQLSLVERDEEGDLHMGAGATDPWWWTANVIDVGVQAAPGLATTGIAARMGYAARYRQALAEAAEKKVPQSVALRYAERQALAAAKRSAVISGGLVEGATAGGGDAAQTRAAIESLDEETLMGYPGYIELRDQGMTHEQAREKVASDKAASVAIAAGAVVGMSGAPMNAFFGQMAAKFGRTAKPATLGQRVASGAKAAAGEGGQEFVQEGAEQLIQNAAKQDVTGEDKPWDQVLESAITGGVLGAVVGAPLGLGGHKAAKPKGETTAGEPKATEPPANQNTLVAAEATYEKAKQAREHAESAARDPSIKVKHADLQAARDAHNQALVDYTRELLAAGQIPEDQQQAVANALQQAEASGVKQAAGKPNAGVTADSANEPAEVSSIQESRTAPPKLDAKAQQTFNSLEAVATAQDIADTDKQDLIAKKLATVTPSGAVLLTPAGRRQRVALGEKVEAVQKHELKQAKTEVKKAALKKPQPKLTLPVEKRAAVEARKVAEAARRAKPAKELAAEKAAQATRDADHLKAVIQAKAETAPDTQMREAFERARRGLPTKDAAKGINAKNAPGGMRAMAKLKGMPETATIAGKSVKVEPVQAAKQAATEYRKAKGITTPEVTTYAKVDPKRGAKIAQAFEEMQHNPNDPVVKQSYRAMIDETKSQWDQIKKTGLKVEFIEPGQADPYAASPRMAIEDVRKNNHLWVFPTDSGFGSDNKFAKGNPMLEDAGEVIGGHKLKNNDVFRIVHDYFGHVQEGNGFRADGEENAWRVHSTMYSPLARRAMTTETRGQNSWVNYGPKGSANRSASSEKTVYADQKIGLLPEEFSRLDEETLKFKHYSNAKDLTELDPSKMGTGAKGEEAKRGGPKVLALYAQDGEVEPEVAMGRTRYDVEIAREDLYDASADPLGMYDKARVPVGITTDENGHLVPVTTRFDMNKFEELIKGAGFKGYYTPGAVGIHKGQARLFAKTPVNRSETTTRPDRSKAMASVKDGLARVATRIGTKIKKFAAANGVVAEFRPFAPYGMTTAIELTDLFADKPGNGAGTRVMQQLIQETDAAGISIVTHPDGPRSHAFYTRFGFESRGHFGLLMRPAPLSAEAIEELGLERPMAKVKNKKAPAVDVLRHLTDVERNKLRASSTKKLVAVFNELPPGTEFASAALAGQAKRGWYERSAKAITEVFGADAPRFAALLAALSPQTSVEWNFRNAVSIWTGWDKAGRPQTQKAIKFLMKENIFPNTARVGKANVLDAWVNNTVTALTTENPESVTLSGPKVDSFAANLRGETNRVTLDAWMANFANVNQTMFKGGLVKAGDPGLRPGYLAYSARVREAAEILSQRTGETWTPAEVQETVWSWAKTVYEQADMFGSLGSAQELVENNEITDALINGTPDFAGLFASPEVKRILQGTAYGDRAADAVSGTQAESSAGREATPLTAADRENLSKAAKRLDELSKQRAAAAVMTPQTETPEFKAWFGASKVVNRNGTPKVVYHGSKRAGFSVFDRGTESGSSGQIGYGPNGFHFSDHVLTAQTYSNSKRSARLRMEEDAEAANYAVYLSLENPLEVDFQEGSWDDAPDESGYGGMSINAISREAERRGHDGVIATNLSDEGPHGQGYNWGTTTYIAFKPEQIKSADFNTGAFDRSNPHIAARVSDTSTKGIPFEKLKAIADRVQLELGVEARVVENVEALRREVPLQYQQDIDFYGEVSGLFLPEEHSGYPRIFLVRENTSSEREAYDTALHEVVGHMGLRAILGEKYQATMDLIYKSFPAQVRGAARRNNIPITVIAVRKEAAERGVVLSNDQVNAILRHNRTLAAEELVAYSAGRLLSMRGGLSKQSVWNKILDIVRTALRAVGAISDYNRADIEALIYRARNYFRKPADVRARQFVYEQSVAAAAAEGKPGPVWYSAAEQAVEDMDLNVASPGQWIGTIKNTKGVKVEEIEWLGLNRWLSEQEGKVTKQQVLEFVAANKTELRDVEHGVPAPQSVKQNRDGTWVVQNGYGAEPFYGDTEEEALDRYAAGRSGTARYARYQTPGGSNYKELLITLPPPSWMYPGRRDAPSQEAANKVFTSSHFSEPNILAHVRFNERTVDGKKVLFIEEVQSDWHQKGRKVGYDAVGGANARKAAKDAYTAWKRAAIDAATEQLVVAGTERNFAVGAAATFPDETLARMTKTQAEFAQAQGELQRTHTLSDGVPDAPFKTSWPELAMKRMIRYAAENGFDTLAWTSGEMQAERYNLSTQVKSIVWYSAPTDARPDGKTVRIDTAADLVELAVDGAGVVTAADQDSLTGKPLDEVVGKEVAEKIMGTPEGDLRGEGLRIGGEGMKGFYDKLLPKTVDKYVKKWGSKTQPLGLTVAGPVIGQYVARDDGDGPQVMFIASNGDPDEVHSSHETMSRAHFRAEQLNASTQAERSQQNTAVHSISITPEMRDSVLAAQPMFKLQAQQEPTPAEYLAQDTATIREGLEAARMPPDLTPTIVFDEDFDAFADPEDEAADFTEVYARADGRRVGYVVLAKDQVTSTGWTADYVYVKPEFRGLGIAQQLYTAISDRLGVKPKPSTIQKPAGKRMWDSFGRRQVMFAFKQPPTGNADLDSFINKIGGTKPSLKQRWQQWNQDKADRLTIAAFDRYYGIRRAEDLAGITSGDSGYKSAVLSGSSGELVQSVIEYGPPVWDQGAPNVGKGQSLLSILKPLRGNVNLWLAYMTGKRAQRLMTEGRENLFKANEIAAAIDLGRQHPEFDVVAQAYAKLQSQVLDFAQEAGVIDPLGRAVWENADYIPFYRIIENGNVGVSAKGGKGIGFIKNQIRQLKGGQENIGDPLENIVRNWLSLMDASLKAHAGRQIVDNLSGTGLVTKHPSVEITQAIVPKAEIKKFLKNNPTIVQTLQSVGLDVNRLPAAAFAGLQKMTAVQPPTDPDVISVWRAGKREYWKVHDPLLFIGLQELNAKAWGPLMKLLTFPKRLLTAGVTLTPQFSIKNYLRDVWHVFVQGAKVDQTRLTVLPYESLRALPATIRMNATARSLLASGGSFTQGYVTGGNPEGATKVVRRAIGQRKGTIAGTVLDSPAKLWRFYRDLQNAAENANRVAIYEKGRKAGLTHKEAAYESRDLLDFSKKGAHPVIQFLVDSVPFFNARLQGLHRLGRGLKEDFVAVALRGLLITAATAAILARNWDDERYKALTDQEKSNYWHFFDVFQDGDHWKFPKPFEVGFLFGTIPESIGDAMLTNADEPDAVKQSAQLVGYSLAQSLNMSPQPQLVWPLVELAINKDSFTQAPILTDGDEKLLPEDQFGPRASPTYRELAQLMPDIAPEALRSPKQLEHLGRGYLGNLQDYALMATDALVREMHGEQAPARAAQDLPGLRDFRAMAPARNTKYLTALYDIANEAAKVQASIKKAEDAGTDEGDARADELGSQYESLLDVADDFKDAAKKVNDLKKKQRAIQLDPDMSPQDKREELDALQEDINIEAQDVWDLRPGGKLNQEVAAELLTAPPTARVTILKQQGMPATAELLEQLLA